MAKKSMIQDLDKRFKEIERLLKIVIENQHRGPGHPKLNSDGKS